MTVLKSELLDRETNSEMTIQIIAKDQQATSSTIPTKSTSVSLNITILDQNDNQPRFIKKVYAAKIIDNIPWSPPSPIIQLTAEDEDIGINGDLYFDIYSGNDDGKFFVDHDIGIIYPNTSLLGQKGKSFELYVSVCDEGKRCDEIGRDQYWENPDTAIIKIDVENVNTHKPVWAPPPPPDETIELMEEIQYDPQFGEPILQVSASDR